MSNDNERPRRRVQITQETFAIVTVGVALAGLMLVTIGDLREEARADRAAWQAESRQMRDEARSDREAFQRASEAFQREILRLTQGQAELRAMVASTQAATA